MAIDLSFLGGLPEGLLTPEQMASAQDRAQRAAALQLGLGMISGATGQRGAGKPRLGQIVAQAGIPAMQAYQGSFDQTLRNALTSMQLSEMQRKRSEQERLRQAISGAYTMRPTAEGVMATQTNIDPALLEGMSAEQVIAAAPRTERAVDRQKLLSAIAEFAPEKYLELTQPKEQAAPASYNEFLLQRNEPGGAKTYTEFLQRKGAPVQVNIGEGQKGLDNELKIRSAFSGEPVYKAYQEMRSAYGQITDSLRQASPAGDLAAATKFMKLLDPGSVVRESELYMAMQASGALDRFVNYANMRISGTKLTPDQRKDFQSLADQLFSTAANTYNAKRNEYANLATQYNLNPDRAVGAPATITRQDAVGSVIDQARAELKRRGL